MISTLTQCIECGGDGVVRSTCPRCGGDGWISKEYEMRYHTFIDADELLKRLERRKNASDVPGGDQGYWAGVRQGLFESTAIVKKMLVEWSK